MQVGQIALSMNGVVQALGNVGGLTISGPDEQKQIREAWYALEPVAVQLIASVGGGKAEVLARALQSFERCVERLLTPPSVRCARGGAEFAALCLRPDAGCIDEAGPAWAVDLRAVVCVRPQSQPPVEEVLCRRHIVGVGGIFFYTMPRELPPPEPPPILPPPEPPPSASGGNFLTCSERIRAEGEHHRGLADFGGSRWSSSFPACVNR
jgi:hypothetical protein